MAGARPYVFTKCILTWNDKGEISPVFSATSIRKECEESLKRLEVSTIDLYQAHWPPQDNGPGLEEAWQTLAALQKEGKVGGLAFPILTPRKSNAHKKLPR